MDIIYIDSKPIFSNEEIHITIKYILENELNSLEKLLFISTLVGQISDETLLKNTIHRLNKLSILQETTNRLIDLDKYIESQLIKDEIDKTKIKATIYSLSFYCRILLKQYRHFIKNCDIPELHFNIVDRKVEHNLSEITELIKRKSTIYVRDEILDLPTIKEKSTEIKKMIQSREIINFDNSTNYFDEEIKHLESIKKNLTQSFKPTDNTKHENIFSNNGFELFEYILNENFIKQIGKRGRYKELSYFYWRLFDDKYIHQKPEPFRNWFIQTYEDEFSKINTKADTETPQRKKNYSYALEWFKQR